MTFFRRTGFYIEYFALRFLAGIQNLLPLSGTYFLAKGWGRLMFFFLKKRRNIVMTNLRMAFGTEKSEKELKAIAIASFINMFDMAYEFSRTPQFSKDFGRYFELEGIEHLKKALEGNKGAIPLVSHFGNWEILAISCGMNHVPLVSVARTMKNPYMYAYIKKLRKMLGGDVIEKQGAARQAIRYLKKNYAVAMLIDQHESRGIWVNFFGRPACTSPLPAVLALRYGVPVLPIFYYRNKKGKSVIRYYPPMKTIQMGDLEKDIAANTQAYLGRIEEEIRKRPGDWLWMHRRWRTPPENFRRYTDKQSLKR